MRLVLTYHATRLQRLTREGCDLLSLHADLDWLADQGIAVLPLDDLLADPSIEGVAITLDDGTRIDGWPHLHPAMGLLPSMLQILQHAKRRLPRLCVSNFVIASPQARDVLATHLVAELGQSLMDADWWSTAQASGLMQLENHSWDHNHPLLPSSVQRENKRGNFLAIDSAEDAEAEIAVASDVIGHALGRRPRYFAYPFGDVSTRSVTSVPICAMSGCPIVDPPSACMPHSRLNRARFAAMTTDGLCRVLCAVEIGARTLNSRPSLIRQGALVRRADQ